MIFDGMNANHVSPYEGRAPRKRFFSAAFTLFLLSAYVVATAAINDSEHSRSLQAAAITGLDHIPVAVRDLDLAARRYRELGFALKPGRPHANGIRNQHVKFPDGTEIELITAPEARDPLTTKYRQHLAEGDGPAFLAFFAPVLDTVSERLDAAKVRYQRNRAYVDITDGQALDYIFFGRRNRSPTDLPEHFAHTNGAESLIGVWLAGDDLSHERAMLEAMGVRLASETVHVPDPLNADVAHLKEGTVVFLPGSCQLVPGRRIVGATLGIASVAKARKAIGAGAEVRSSPSSIFLPPSSTHGLWLELWEVR
jgi:catechol 2,3-dioxygenase-like lactoylglutathione lyase family enzyme